MPFDMQFFNIINGLACKNILLDKSMITFSRAIPIIFILVLLIVYICGILNKDEQVRCIAVDICMITVIGLIFSFIIGKIFYVPRPFVNNSHVNLLIQHASNSSFPSDHALFTMCIALGMFKYDKKFGFILILLSLLCGFSRIFVGNHYPSDILGGILLAIFVNYVYNISLKYFFRKIYLTIEHLLMRRTA